MEYILFLGNDQYVLLQILSPIVDLFIESTWEITGHMYIIHIVGPLKKDLDMQVRHANFFLQKLHIVFNHLLILSSYLG